MRGIVGDASSSAVRVAVLGHGRVRLPAIGVNGRTWASTVASMNGIRLSFETSGTDRSRTPPKSLRRLDFHGDATIDFVAVAAVDGAPTPPT